MKKQLYFYSISLISLTLLIFLQSNLFAVTPTFPNSRAKAVYEKINLKIKELEAARKAKEVAIKAKHLESYQEEERKKLKQRYKELQKHFE